MNELHLFAGAGGGILGGILLGHTTVCAVEIEPYCRKILLQRQRDGILPKFPIWDDVKTFDGKPWRGKVDIVCGGFPCQDISIAGTGEGLKGKRSGLWAEFARIIGEVRPIFAFIENSPMLTVRGLDAVLCDLARMGYDAKWCVLGADDVGAPHRRKRIWILAYTRCEHGKQRNSTRVDTKKEIRPSSSIYDKSSSTRQGDISDSYMLGCVHGQTEEFTAEGRITPQPVPGTGCEDVPDSMSERLQRISSTDNNGEVRSQSTNEQPTRCSRESRCEWWSVEPILGRVANGVAHRVDRLKAIGNGQVPQCAAYAFQLLVENK